MPRSMTGYGAAREAGPRIAVEAEVRSVNARNLKLTVRAPSQLAPHEAELERLVRRYVRRGSVTLSVRLTFLRPDDLLRVRTEVVESFARALARLRKRGLVEGTLTPEALAQLEEAWDTAPEKPLRPADVKLVRRVVERALAALDTMRRREAVHLVRDLRRTARNGRKLVGAIRKRAPAVVREAHAKLRRRVRELLEGAGLALDEASLAREAALLADRCDITEELTRLDAHLAEFLRYLELDEEVGRRLDFLGQELLREANTIGSKSADVAIAQAVVELKTEIDRLKEQSANLE